MLEPLAAALAASDAAPGQLAGVESAAAADVPPPLLQMRHAILHSRAMLAAAEAAADATPSDGAQQATDPVADVFAAEITAAAVRPVVPALMAYLQPALAAIPRQPPPLHQAYSDSARNQQQQQQQQQQRQPSGGSLHGSWSSGGQHLDASSSWGLQSRGTERRTSARQCTARCQRSKQMLSMCFAAQCIHCLRCCRRPASCRHVTSFQRFIVPGHYSDCCPSAGSCELQRTPAGWPAAAAWSCRLRLRLGVSTIKILAVCTHSTSGACKGSERMHFNLQSALRALW